MPVGSATTPASEVKQAPQECDRKERRECEDQSRRGLVIQYAVGMSVMGIHNLETKQGRPPVERLIIQRRC